MDDFGIAKFLKSYRFVDRSLWFVGLESMIVAFIIGMTKENVGWGIGSYIIIMLLYKVPVAGGVFAFVFSLVESMTAGFILSHYTSMAWAWIIGIVVFMTLVRAHQIYGDVGEISKGYSLVIFDSLVISSCTYIVCKNVIGSVVLFIVLIIMMFVPIMRVIESIILSLGTAVLVYYFASGSLDKPYLILVTLFSLIYTGISYAFAYELIDYKGMIRTSKQRKYMQEYVESMNDIRMSLYQQFPELEKKCYYFYTEVCQTEKEKEQFKYDWDNYLIYLNASGERISFNQYFEKEKLYRTSKYNRDYAKNSCNSDEFGNDEKVDNKKENEKIVYFTGVDSIESLKKRYHDLLKIYHPDNQNGDERISKKIQEEYDFLMEKLKK